MISIIIPAYYEEKAIAGTITQFKKGLSPDFTYEIIVSDGGSQDKTVENARTANPDKIVIFPNDRKQTISGNRNNGAEAAQGEFLVFIDSGVSICGDVSIFMSSALSHFERDANLLALTADIKVDPKIATVMDKAVFGIMNITFYVMNNVIGQGLHRENFRSFVVRHFQKLGGYREDLPASEDFELFSRISKIGKTKLDPKLVVYHGSRRAHALGWPTLLFHWYRDAVWLMLFDKVYSKEWKVVR